MGRRSSSFSLTNNGRTKSWTLNCVSRTRFRKAAEHRKRRGRCTNLLMQRDGTLAKLGRKQAAEARQKNGVTRNRTNDGQMLDGMRRSVSAS